ncbi:MAG: acetyltransferase [Cyanobacteria bacterium]|nr:acetyltransferase [Cyanobacteriota bacterium]
MTKAIGFGAGGHAKVVLEILQRDPRLDIRGLLAASSTETGREVSGVRVIGVDSLLPALISEGVTHGFIGVGGTSTTGRRRALYERATNAGLTMLAAVHPAATISPTAIVGAGVTIMAGVIVNASARICDNVILNTGAIIEHDVVIGDHCHIAPGANVGGGVTIGAGAHVGMGAIIRQGQKIGAGAIVGAGAVVVADVADGETVAGLPARPLKTR